MKSFIVCENTTNWNDPQYRAIAGCTYSEESLREWAKRVWNVRDDATIPEIASTIALGGWSLVEKIEPATLTRSVLT